MFADANFLAHVSRLLEVGRVLRDERGFDVAFAGDGPFLRLAADDGFRTVPCYTVPRDDTLSLAGRASLVEPFWWRRVCALSIRSDLEVIRSERPGVVVGDMHWSLKAAAAESGVPYVSLVNAAWTNHLDHRIRALDGHVLTRLLGRGLAERALPGFRSAALWYWAFPYKLWRRADGRRRGFRARNLFDVIEGDVTLLPDVPEFCPTRGLPPSCRYVGPLLWAPRLQPPPWLDRLSRDAPTVYVSMGSTGSRRLFDTAVRAFAGTPYQVLMTTGSIGLDTANLPPNVFVTDYAPGEPLLARSAVSVNHGGNGSIYQSLRAGVPVVGLPGHADQQLQLQLCERSGVGRALPPSRVGPEALRRAVDEVREQPSYRENAARLAAAIARYDAPRLAASAVEEALEGAPWPSS